MKLLFCPQCGDVVALRSDSRTCTCGASAGHYIHSVVAEVRGPCLVLSFPDHEFVAAVRAQILHGDPKSIAAFPDRQKQVRDRAFPAFILPHCRQVIRSDVPETGVESAMTTAETVNDRPRIFATR